ncbi:matrix metalloproteinase-9-like [Xenia sp. Carnegie-2017]|uniref:matrix metalloproteinase-9-like n=1 Tax=Xenia sp. Carnegie-2017 TaxID=2897299 RepID=UPI001F04350B|nr:matrix metalloproteinase-9-like [Xenia sp. Carnegie-2017]
MRIKRSTTNVQFEALTANGHTCYAFTYQGVTYSAGTCTDVDGYGQYWCAITNVPNGVYIGAAGQGNWDYCVVKKASTTATTTAAQSGLTTINGHTCHIPFLYQGVTYTRCTSVDGNGQYWCATADVPNGVYVGAAGLGNWDWCQ